MYARFVIAKTVREVLDVVSGPGPLLWRRRRSCLSRAGDGSQNEMKRWNGDKGCYCMCLPMSPFLRTSGGSFISGWV